MRPHQPLDPERAALVADHLPVARHVAWRYARTLPRWIEPEEILSKTVEALVVLARDWDPDRCPAFPAYVNTFLRRRLIDMIRVELGRHGQRVLPRARLEDADVDLDEVLPDPALGPEDLIAAFDEEDAARLWELVDELPARQGLVLRWRFCSGFDQPTIGRLLGVTPSRVSQIESAAMRALRGPARRAELV